MVLINRTFIFISFIFIFIISSMSLSASEFAKYWGIDGYYTRNYNSFSKNVKDGNFIAVDYGVDNDYDHLGYVTGYYTMNNGNYRDLDIAQHTSDYYGRTSSTAKGWKTDCNSNRCGVIDVNR